MIDFIHRLNLQLFADGGAAGAAGAAGGAAGADGAGVSGSDAGNQGVGQNPTGNEEAADLDAEFQELIKGKYKDAYNKHFRTAMDGRMAKSQKAERRAREQQGILDAFGAALGIDSHDSAAMLKAAQDYGIEDEALENGWSVEETRLRRENKRLKAREQAQIEIKRNAMLDAEAEEVRATFPSFDYEAECAADPRYEQLCKLVGMESAFKMLHEQEITEGIIQYTANKVREGVSKSIASGNGRPRENGVSSKGAVSAKARVDAMSDAQIMELAQQAMRGRTPIKI